MELSERMTAIPVKDTGVRDPADSSAKERRSAKDVLAAKDARAAYEALRCIRPRRLGQLYAITAVGQYSSADEHPKSLNQIPVFHGSSRLQSSMGFTYTGNFMNGLPCGPGMLEWVDGYKVEGIFRDGVVGGSGSFHDSYGGSYAGNIEGGARHGHGTYTSHAEKEKYVGEWFRGKRNGKGTQYYVDGGTYEGEWRENLRHGYGTMRYHTKDCYEGEWKNDLPCGHGVMGWAGEGGQFYSEVYDGQWRDGVAEGDGVSMYIRFYPGTSNSSSQVDEPLISPVLYAPPQGCILNVYKGEYERSQRHGYGVFYYADGSSFRGEWVNGAKYGRGRCTSSVGLTSQTQHDGSAASANEMPELYQNAEMNVDAMPQVHIGNFHSLLEKDEELKEVLQGLVLRYNTLLRSIFQHYSSQHIEVALPSTEPMWWRNRIPGHMTVPQCLRLLVDGHILGRNFTICAALRLMADVFDAEKSVNGQSMSILSAETVEAISSIYHGDGVLNYRQFCDWLIRVAAAVCVGPRFTLLDSKVRAFMEYLSLIMTRDEKSAGLVEILPRSYVRYTEVRKSLKLLTRMFDCITFDGERSSLLISTREVLNAYCKVLHRHNVSVVSVLQHVLPPIDSTVPPHNSCISANRSAGDLDEELWKISCKDGWFIGTDADASLSFVEFIELMAIMGDAVEESDRTGFGALIKECSKNMYM